MSCVGLCSKRVMLLDLEPTMELACAHQCRPVVVDYTAVPEFWDWRSRRVGLHAPAPQPTMSRQPPLVPGADGKLYHIPGHMPWPPDHTRMLVIEDRSIRDAAANWAPSELLPSVAGMAIAYLDMPYWRHPWIRWSSWNDFSFVSSTSVTQHATIFCAGGGAFGLPSLTFGWADDPRFPLRMPDRAVAARFQVEMNKGPLLISEQTFRLPLNDHALAISRHAPAIWGYLPPMELYWLTDEHPDGVKLTIELSFVDEEDTPLDGVNGQWLLEPNIGDAATPLYHRT